VYFSWNNNFEIVEFQKGHINMKVKHQDLKIKDAALSTFTYDYSFQHHIKHTAKGISFWISVDEQTKSQYFAEFHNDVSIYESKNNIFHIFNNEHFQCTLCNNPTNDNCVYFDEADHRNFVMKKVNLTIPFLRIKAQFQKNIE
jgi:hypothetical protein